MAASATFLSIAICTGLVYTIPPPQCFATFNWNDCGKTPQPVIYYWKPGSRCEVGIWRGCLPNINMFKDEYECVSTCIFTVRASDPDWHQINAIDEDITENVTDYDDKGNGTDFGNSTSEYENTTSVDSTGPADNESATEGGDADAAGASSGEAGAGDHSAGDAASGGDAHADSSPAADNDANEGAENGDNGEETTPEPEGGGDEGGDGR